MFLRDGHAVSTEIYSSDETYPGVFPYPVNSYKEGGNLYSFLYLSHLSGFNVYDHSFDRIGDDGEIEFVKGFYNNYGNNFIKIC